MNQALKKLPMLDKALNFFTPTKKFDSFIFLDREFFLQIQHLQLTPKKSIGAKKCVIISPSLYWVKKKELPNINSKYKAKKIASAVLEDFTNNDSYQIRIARGEANEYFFLAIDKNELQKRLHSHFGIDAENYEFVTAQEFFANIQKPIGLNESYSLASIEGTIEKIPTAYISDSSGISVQNFVRENKASFKSFSIKKERGANTPLTMKKGIEGLSGKLLTYSLALLAAAWLIEGIVNIKRSFSVSSDIQNLRETYKLPSTSMEVDNVVSKAKNIEKKQNDIRLATKAFNNLILAPGEAIDSIKISNTEVSVAIKTTRAKELESMIKKELSVSTTQEGDKTIFKAIIK